MIEALLVIALLAAPGGGGQARRDHPGRGRVMLQVCHNGQCYLLPIPATELRATAVTLAFVLACVSQRREPADR